MINTIATIVRIQAKRKEVHFAVLKSKKKVKEKRLTSQKKKRLFLLFQFNCRFLPDTHILGLNLRILPSYIMGDMLCHRL